MKSPPLGGLRPPPAPPAYGLRPRFALPPGIPPIPLPGPRRGQNRSPQGRESTTTVGGALRRPSASGPLPAGSSPAAGCRPRPHGRASPPPAAVAAAPPSHLFIRKRGSLARLGMPRTLAHRPRKSLKTFWQGVGLGECLNRLPAWRPCWPRWGHPRRWPAVAGTWPGRCPASSHAAAPVDHWGGMLAHLLQHCCLPQAKKNQRSTLVKGREP